jgi:hypothetical protein
MDPARISRQPDDPESGETCERHVPCGCNHTICFTMLVLPAMLALRYVPRLIRAKKQLTKAEETT